MLRVKKICAISSKKWRLKRKIDFNTISERELLKSFAFAGGAGGGSAPAPSFCPAAPPRAPPFSPSCSC